MQDSAKDNVSFFLISNFIIFDMTVHRASVHYGFYDTAEYTDQVDNFNCIFLSDIFKTFKDKLIM